MSTNPRVSQELRDKAKVMYCSGETTVKIANDLGLKLCTVRRMVQREGWLTDKQQSLELSKQAIVTAVAEQKVRKSIEIINPIVEELSKKAMNSLAQDESQLTSKDHVRTLATMIKLKAQLEGDLDPIVIHNQYNSSVSWSEIYAVLKDNPGHIEVKPSRECVLIE